MTKEQEMLPCPFCGGTETKINRGGVDDEIVYDQCVKCEAGGPTSYPRQDNDSPTWNTRASSVKGMQWIKASERLPEKDGEYHILWYDKHSEDKWVANYSKEKQFYIDDQIGYLGKDQVKWLDEG